MTLDALKLIEKMPFTLRNSHLFRGGQAMLCKNTTSKVCGLHCPFFGLSIGDEQAGAILTCGQDDNYLPLELTRKAKKRKTTQTKHGSKRPKSAHGRPGCTGGLGNRVYLR